MFPATAKRSTPTGPRRCCSTRRGFAISRLCWTGLDVTRGRVPGRNPGDRFNAATASKPWVTTAYRDGDGRPGALQCGHGFEAVGDIAQVVAEPVPAPLQCGHGFEAVGDVEQARHVVARLLGFNAATASKPWV